MINRTAAHVSRRATHAGREARRPCDEEVAEIHTECSAAKPGGSPASGCMSNVG